MFHRYIVTLQPAGRSLPPSFMDDPATRAVYEMGDFRVVVDVPDARPESALQIDHRLLPNRLIITEGTIIAADSSTRPCSGTYNQLIIGDGEARLHNDTFGLLACYFAQSDGVIHISNSLRLLRDCAGLPPDGMGIAQMYLFAGWTANERTILRGGQRFDVGSEYRFRLGSDAPPAVTRLTRTWTDVIDDRPAVIIDRVCELWQAAVERHIDPINTPIGLLLSGGLDSRMVAGGIASRGKALIGLTFGDLRSDEVRIAGEVAAVTEAKWIPYGLDADFPFEQLAFERVNRINETLYNVMWDSICPRLVAEGATHFSTGAAFETILGGWREPDRRRRFMKNMRHSLIGPSPSRPASAAERTEQIEEITNRARKRARNYSFLLVEPYRSLMIESLPGIREEVAARVERIAASGPITAAQILERFDSEQYQTHHSRDVERQLLTYGALTLPTCDGELANYLTNLPAGLKYDHALYYHVIRRLYPHLAAIQVPNLGTDVNKSQLRIELTRVWHIQRKTRLTFWVNFPQWMSLGDNLNKYERLFLAQPEFFDPDSVRAYFNDVRSGRKYLYDGSESAGFLNLAMLLDENRREVAYPIAASTARQKLP